MLSLCQDLTKGIPGRLASTGGLRKVRQAVGLISGFPAFKTLERQSVKSDRQKNCRLRVSLDLGILGFREGFQQGIPVGVITGQKKLNRNFVRLLRRRGVLNMQSLFPSPLASFHSAKQPDQGHPWPDSKYRRHVLGKTGRQLDLFRIFVPDT